MKRAVYCDPCRGKCKDRAHRSKQRRSWVQSSEPGEPMTGRVYARFATAGGTTVDLRYRPIGIKATCNGCGKECGAGNEVNTRRNAQEHAMKCARKAAA